MKIFALVVIFFSILLNPNNIKANETILFVDSVLILNNSLAGKSINNQLKILNTNLCEWAQIKKRHVQFYNTLIK